MTHPSIGFIGGGNMARSLIGGLIAQGHPPARIAVSEPQPALRDALARDFSVRTGADNAGAANGADLIVLAVKPQVMKAVCRELGTRLSGPAPLFLSIAAGIRLTQFERWLGRDAAVVRAMPNTPALIGEGIAGLIANPRVDAAQRALAETVLQAAGRTVWIAREDLMDVVTAVSGSGPAYFFLLLEALEAAGIAQGLPADAARELCLQTCLGAARMARGSAESPATLRARVTSPGGTTQAALAVLEAGGFRRLIGEAIARATQRGAELSDQLGD